MSDLLDLASNVVGRLVALGADEASATASAGTHVTIQRRAGKVEQATEATTRGLVVSCLVKERFTSNSTSDLRPSAMDAFLERCIASAAFLEPDPDRALPPAELTGRGVTDEELDQDDPAWKSRTSDDRSKQALAMEEALDARRADDVISTSTYSADGRSEVVRVTSNGFSGRNQGAWFTVGGECTLRDGEKRPEAGAYFAARHLADLPSEAHIAEVVEQRVRERIGAGPIESGTYPLVLANRAAGSLLGTLAGPLSGGAIHQHRSCLSDRKGTAIGSSAFTVIDDPTIPRGLGSRPWDGDGMAAKRRVMIEQGVLQGFNISVYHGRKLGCEPTSGSRSNWIIRPGDRPWKDAVADAPRAIWVSSFLGGNSNGTTGDFSFGIRGMLLENGEPIGSLSEMNVSGNLLEVFHKLIAVGDDPWMWSSVRSPTLVFEDVQFSGT